MVNNPNSSSDSGITSAKSTSDSNSSTESSHNDSPPTPPPVKRMLDYNVVLAIAIEKSRRKLEEENAKPRHKGFELERFPCLHFHSRRR